MVKNIAIIVLILMVAFVSVFALQKARDADEIAKKLEATQIELKEMSGRAERLKKNAEEQAAKAINAEANAIKLARELENSKK